MSNLLTTCCCQPCNELCPSDGEDGNCPLNSFASAYSIDLDVSWDSAIGGAGFGDNGLTYTKMITGGTAGPCWTGGGEFGTSWNYKCIWWKPPTTGGFPPQYVLGNYTAFAGSGCSYGAYNNSYNQVNTQLGPASTGPGGIFTRQGLLLVHEFDCDATVPYSMYYYIYSIYRAVTYVPSCNIGASTAIECHVIAYSTPSTQCALEPDELLDWNLQSPSSGSLASQSRIIQSITTGTYTPGFLSFFYRCPLGQDCNDPGGSPHSNINFSLAVT